MVWRSSDTAGVGSASAETKVSTDDLKDWIASVPSIVLIFVALAGVGLMSAGQAAAAMVGCSAGMGLWFALGSTGRSIMTAGTQLVPWLPPPAPLPAGPVAELPDPDVSTVTGVDRFEWGLARVLIWTFMAPLLVAFFPTLVIRRLLDKVA
jgi:hypothetical protein